MHVQYLRKVLQKEDCKSLKNWFTPKAKFFTPGCHAVIDSEELFFSKY
jgi:hypothetical protein